MKIRKNGDFTLAIPQELGVWLSSILEKQPNDELFFPNPEHAVYSEATLRKALRAFKPDFPCIEKNITPHSFRRILSTLTSEKRTENDIQYDDIDRVLAHQKKKIRKHYDKSKDMATKRMVLEWWLKYLKQNGLELKL